ncbi:ATP-binding cassette domain-containing protein [Pendulispora albinea]|uniref:ATP-binding cassette domain-containing protein n=1 Tax=Pendulispora albinea TaxID=2741071 RepID=A0ABZ2LJT8_9BACT
MTHSVPEPASAGASLTVSLAIQRGAFHLDVAFEAPPGITILFGPSGSGKSTVLAAIAGLLRPDRGRVALGTDVWLDSTQRIDRPVHLRRVAFVFQSLALFPHMSAVGNVVYGMDRTLAREVQRTKARELLARFHVAHLENRRPSTYSGGEAQRVALARAFAMAPRVVLLDEPFSAMDRDLRESLCADVRASASELGVPFIHVTHHRQEVRLLADRVIYIDNGRRVAGSDEPYVDMWGSGS